ncbi:MAG: protein translocase subunit SecF [Candidatus Nanopelagicales bacterium]
MSKLGDIGHRLYSGEISLDIVSARKKWYILSGTLVGLSLLSLLVRGINPGIEFTGGAEFQAVSSKCTVEQARQAVQDSGAEVATVTLLGSERVRVTTEAVSNAQGETTRKALAEACGVSADEVDAQVVGPTWGGEITKKAIWAMAWFLGLLAVFLIAYFNWQMAVAAIVALIHDVVITVGVYSILQFEVTPATVIGVLTILGYSMYDTVVVFDKIKENTRGILGQSRQTYADAANMALNQTLIRSINTSIVAILPVGAILFVGAGILGAGTLKDLSLALFVGTLAGTYSSIFLATPLLVDLMNRNPQMQALAKRVTARGSGQPRSKAVKAPVAPPRRSAGKSAPAATLVAEPPSSTGASQPAGQVDFDVVPAGGEAGEADEDSADEAMARARARRAAQQTGGRAQPKRSPKSKRH